MRVARPLTAVAMALLSLASTTAQAQPPTVTRWNRIDDVKGFAGWRAQLQHMANHDATTPVSHMCIVVATYSRPSIHDTTIWGYLYWREAHKLYTLDRSDEQMSDLSIVKAPLDLRTDVARRQRDVGSSTFIETRSWVDNVLHHCDKDGTNIAVRKSDG